MQITLRATAAVLLGLVFSLAVAAQGQDFGLTAVSDQPPLYEQRLQEMQNEIEMLKSRLHSAPAGCQTSCTQCDPCQSSGLYAGYSAFFVKPHFKESFQASSLSGVTGVFSLIPFDYDYDPTPRFWLGYVGCSGMGARVGYWEYDHNGTPLTLQSDPTTVVAAYAMTVIFPATISSVDPGEVLSVTNGLTVRMLDMEATQKIQLGNITLVGSGGIRYALMDQRFAATITDGGVPEQQLAWQRRFEGIGPTVAADFRRPLGCGGWAAVGSVRGALLFGQKNLNRFVFPAAAASPPLPFASLTDADEVVGGGELSVGLEWSRPLTCGNLYVRGTYEGQLWADAGAPTLTFLGFEGFNVSIGIDR